MLLSEQLDQAAEFYDAASAPFRPEARRAAMEVANELSSLAARAGELLAKYGLSEMRGICACGACAGCDLLAFLGTRWADGRPTLASNWPIARRAPATPPETPGTTEK